jgi:hypothetical protein
MPVKEEFIFGYEKSGSPELLDRLAAIQAEYGEQTVVCSKKIGYDTIGPRVRLPDVYDECRVWTPRGTQVFQHTLRVSLNERVSSVSNPRNSHQWNVDPRPPTEIVAIEDSDAFSTATKAFLEAQAEFGSIITWAYRVPDRTAFILTKWAIESLAVEVSPKAFLDARAGIACKVGVACRNGNLGDVQIISVES